MIIVILLLLILFIFYNQETFINPQYPDILLFQNKKYWLLNSSKPLTIDNPINFSTIQQYKKYAKKKKYPILKVKTSNVPKFMLRLLVNSSKKPKIKQSIVSKKQLPISKKQNQLKIHFSNNPIKKFFLNMVIVLCQLHLGVFHNSVHHLVFPKSLVQFVQ